MPDNSPWSRRRPPSDGRPSSPLGDSVGSRTPGQLRRPPDREATVEQRSSSAGTPPGVKATASPSTMRVHSTTSRRSRERVGSKRVVAGSMFLLLSVFGVWFFLSKNGRTEATPASEASTATSIGSTDSIIERSSSTAATSESTLATNAQSTAVNWDEVSRSIVFIEAASPCDWRGSGTIVLDGTYILTNQHVSASGECDLRVGLTDNLNSTPSLSHNAIVLVADEALDLAVLRLLDPSGQPFASGDHKPVEIDSSQPPLGSEVATLGYPALGSYDAGMTITFTRGTFSGIDYTDGKFYKTDAAMRGGVSGGGAFNSNGKLIGVPTAGLIDEDSNDPVGINLIRPIELAKTLLQDAQTALQTSTGSFDYETDVGELTGQMTDTDPRFDTCREAIDNGYGPYVDGIHVEYDWYRDRDGDGVVCER